MLNESDKTIVHQKQDEINTTIENQALAKSIIDTAEQLGFDVSKDTWPELCFSTRHNDVLITEGTPGKIDVEVANELIAAIQDAHPDVNASLETADEWVHVKFAKHDVNGLQFQHGTREEHLATLERARASGVNSIWSGDIRRNPYLHENMLFAEREGIVKLTPYELEQESGWTVEWLQNQVQEEDQSYEPGL